MKHGTTTRYNKKGCRCEPCRKASATYRAALRQRKNERLLNGTAEINHGTKAGYEYHLCRCSLCCEIMVIHRRSPEYQAMQRAWYHKNHDERLKRGQQMRMENRAARLAIRDLKMIGVLP